KEIETSNENIRHGEIVFDNVTFSYPYERKLILKNISFSVCPGEQLAVIGATGAGKTSLFQLIPRLYEPDEGVIYLDDRPLVSYDLRILRNSVGYVPQSPLLFTGTIKENIAFGKEDAEENEVIQAAKDAQIHNYIDRLPNKYDTVVGQRGVNLSGGQKQRISIARALIRQPKILMLDDSTSALYALTEANLLRALRKYDCTTLMITLALHKRD